jgi:hypothetical protein
LTKITHPKEWQQYEDHKFELKKTSEDKAYQTFLNTIMDEDGNLNKIGGKEIPEEIIEMCRVLDPMNDNKEYLVYDVVQWGYMEDGQTKTPMVHLQDMGVWREFEWVKKPIPQPVFSGQPQRRQFKESPESFQLKYDIPFTREEVGKLKPKCKNTRLYVYDLSKSGRGGKDGKIAVDNWDDFIARPFKELIEGTYLLKNQLQLEINAAKQKQQYLDMERKTLEIEKKNSK